MDLPIAVTLTCECGTQQRLEGKRRGDSMWFEGRCVGCKARLCLQARPVSKVEMEPGE